MKFTYFLKPELIRHDVIASSKKRSLEMIGELAASYFNQQYGEERCKVACFSSLFKREKLGSTCINNGIALPHAKLPASQHFSQPLALFLQLADPIDFEAADNREVDLIFAMFFPEGACEQYKSALPDLAQRLSDKHLAKQLRSAGSAEEIWQVFEYADSLEAQASES
ncbi:PTS sugar transporter subunit IIA [Pasteurellaceae bacterium RH1A]|nr:PTS sugar transporter subunit IIA [Pasteurellaceae bacterium RH1A]